MSADRYTREPKPLRDLRQGDLVVVSMPSYDVELDLPYTAQHLEAVSETHKVLLGRSTLRVGENDAWFRMNGRAVVQETAKQRQTHIASAIDERGTVLPQYQDLYNRQFGTPKQEPKRAPSAMMSAVSNAFARSTPAPEKTLERMPQPDLEAELQSVSDEPEVG